MEAIFTYQGSNIIIYCNILDKMKVVIDQFLSKIKLYDEFIFLYNGTQIDPESSLKDQINELDLNRRKMNIVVSDYENENSNNECKIVSKEPLCPECGENIIINIKDHKIDYECKNNHSKNNLSFKEYMKKQEIDLTKIICSLCKENNKYKSYKNQFYFCCSCKKNICPLCKDIHNKKHNIINYEDKNFICWKHNELFIKYCKKCKENLCFICLNKHKCSNIISLENIIINKEELIKENEEYKNIIDKIKNNVISIKAILNNILNNIEAYYKVSDNFIKNYDYKQRNYEILTNINALKNFNNYFIKNLKDIINEKDITKRFNYLVDIFLNIYNKNKNITKKYENGDLYIGESKFGLKNGKGILYYNEKDDDNRERYEGEWKNDLKEGKGKLYWRNGDRYEGDFKSDKREGKGIKICISGVRYEGNFKDNKFEGKGIYYFKNGDKYEGDFKDNKFEGKGIFYYKNGDKYEGDFKNDLREGKGVFYWENGSKYEGDFKKNKREGKGIKYFTNGNRYEGDYKNGKFDGKGIYYFANGNRYEGDFKNNNFEGKGLYFYNNGDIEIGEYFEDNKIGKHIKVNLKGDFNIIDY